MNQDRYLHSVFDVAPKLRSIDIPVSVIIERGGLTMRQSLIRYLVDHPEGPGLEVRDAAAIVGTTTEGVSATLATARRKVEGSRRPPHAAP